MSQNDTTVVSQPTDVLQAAEFSTEALLQLIKQAEVEKAEMLSLLEELGNSFYWVRDHYDLQKRLRDFLGQHGIAVQPFVTRGD